MAQASTVINQLKQVSSNPVAQPVAQPAAKKTAAKKTAAKKTATKPGTKVQQKSTSKAGSTKPKVQQKPAPTPTPAASSPAPTQAQLINALQKAGLNNQQIYSLLNQRPATSPSPSPSPWPSPSPGFGGSSPWSPSPGQLGGPSSATPGAGNFGVNNPFGNFTPVANQPGGNGTLDPAMLAQWKQYAEQIANKVTTGVTGIAGTVMDTIPAQIDSANKMAKINADGLIAQLAFGTAFESAYVQADLANNLATQAMGLSAKGWESALLVAQYREKTAGMFAAIADARSTNSFARIKTLTQGFKF